VNTIPAKSQVVPTLQNGDRLTVAEFEKRYAAMPEVKKAELIEGVVYMPSPVSTEFHGDPSAVLVTWLGIYRLQTPGTQHADNSTVRLRNGANQPQPDVFLRICQENGGQSRLDKKGFVIGAPELTAEVAATSANYDLHQKLHAYEKNGVQEYIVWRVEDDELDWFALNRGKYRRLRPSSKGHIESRVFPGLWLDAPALIRGDLTQVFAVAQTGLASFEHARFVEKLQKRKKG